MNQTNFNAVCENIMNEEQKFDGIGTLSEKTVHAVLKNYYAKDTSHHEIRVNNFIADIVINDEIIEIQSGNFDKLRRKLTSFLPLYPVTLVYPIHRHKQIYWINPQTGEISKPRKSPKKRTIYEVFPELYKIKNFLCHDNLKLIIVLIDVDDYRYLDGWSKDKKRGCTRSDCIPTKLIRELFINSVSDYQVFLPENLNDNFTSRDFAKAASIPLPLSQKTLNILHHMEIVVRTGKKGNAYLYKKIK